MAATNTPSRTVADNIRGSVSKLLTQETKSSQTNAVVQSLNTKTPQERTSLCLQASSAVYRATKDRHFKPSQAQLQTYAAAVELIAAKRGITPPEGETKFSDSQLKKELAPKELIKYFAAETLVASNDETAARNQISADINSAYEGSTAPKEISGIKNMPAPKTDDEILAMTDEDELKTYLGYLDVAEQERINKLLETKKRGDDIRDEDIGRYKGRMRDPDWGYKKDDDNFKIEQGDIIDYLMKEVILASAAWAGNKTAGFVGIVGYEILSGVHHNVTQPAWKQVKKFFSSSEEEGGSSSGGGNDGGGNGGSSTNPDVLASFNQIYDNNINAYTNSITANLSDDPRKDTLAHYQERLIYNTAIIGDDTIIEFDGNSKPFNQISDSVDVKKDFTEFRDNIRKAQLSNLQKLYPGHEAEVETWYKDRLAYEENLVLTKDQPTLPVPKAPDFAKDIETKLTACREQQLTDLAFLPTKNLFRAQMGLFAEHYAAYKVYDLSHQTPQSDILTDPNKLKDFVDKSQTEAKYIFLIAEKQRLQGNSVMSRDALIAEAQSLATRAKENPNVKDEKLITIVDPSQASKEKTETLISDYAKLNYQDLYKTEITDIALRTQELGAANNDLQRRRNLVQKAYNIVDNDRQPNTPQKPAATLSPGHNIPKGR